MFFYEIAVDDVKQVKFQTYAIGLLVIHAYFKLVKMLENIPVMNSISTTGTNKVPNSFIKERQAHECNGGNCVDATYRTHG